MATFGTQVVDYSSEEENYEDDDDFEPLDEMPDISDLEDFDDLPHLDVSPGRKAHNKKLKYKLNTDGSNSTTFSPMSSSSGFGKVSPAFRENNRSNNRPRHNLRVFSGEEEDDTPAFEISPLSDRPSIGSGRFGRSSGFGSSSGIGKGPGGFKKPSLGLFVEPENHGEVVMGGILAQDDDGIHEISDGILTIQIDDDDDHFNNADCHANSTHSTRPRRATGYRPRNNDNGSSSAPKKKKGISIDVGGGDGESKKNNHFTEKRPTSLISFEQEEAEEEEDVLDHSYKVDHKGSLFIGGWEVSNKGLQKTPNKKRHEQRRRSSILVMNQEKDVADLLDLDAQLTDLRKEDIVVLKRLGAGASGTVRKCFHAPSLCLIAVKTISIFDRAKRASIEKELGIFGTVDCNEIVTYYGAFFDEGKLQICMEFMNKGALQDVVESEGPLSEPALQTVALKVTKGLNYLHSRHEVHRDIKPGNILLNHQGDIKIADFGITTELDNTDAQCQTVVGTSAYMSPERINAEQYAFPSDVWALGLTLMFCGLGKLPYDLEGGGFFALASQIVMHASPRMPGNEFSPECVDFVDKCLIKDPRKRATTFDLLRHPFLSKTFTEDAYVEGKCHLNFDPLSLSRTIKENDKKELDHICKVVCETLYADKLYTGNEVDLGRLKRISQQLAVPFNMVEKHFQLAVKGRRFVPRHLKPLLYS